MPYCSVYINDSLITLSRASQARLVIRIKGDQGGAQMEVIWACWPSQIPGVHGLSTSIPSEEERASPLNIPLRYPRIISKQFSFMIMLDLLQMEAICEENYTHR